MTPKRTRHESTQCEVRTQRSYYAHPWATLRKLWSNFLTFAMNALVARLQDRTSFASDDQADYADELAQELVALQSIYGNEQVELKSGAKVREPITFQVQLPCEDMGHNVCIKFQIQLPIGYPNCHEPPQIELVNRFLQPFHTDESVRHAVQNTFSPHGAAPWTQGEPVLFQGIDTAYELVLNWWKTKRRTIPPQQSPLLQAPKPTATMSPSRRQINLDTLVQSDLISERKSEFLGHAAHITHPDDVRYIKLTRCRCLSF